jgi:regulator of protease activity HflC (stomatin/prohibitin superfamily)
MDILGMIAAIFGIGAVAGAAVTAASARVVTQYEKGLVFRFGRVVGVRDPGLRMLIPFVDKMRKVSTQVVTMPVPGQDGITRDNVTVRVDAVVYFRVIDPVAAVVDVQNYLFAVGQVAQTSLRSIIGKSELDDLLSNREQLNKGLELMIDSPALAWGVHIDRVEIKDVALPDSLKRSMSRQAEAERERRARVISAEGELQASHMLAEAGARMADSPASLQLRLLETVVQVAAEKNSTLVLPFPVELLRFLERGTAPAPASSAQPAEEPAAAAETSPQLSEASQRTEKTTVDEASELNAPESVPELAPARKSASERGDNSDRDDRPPAAGRTLP